MEKNYNIYEIDEGESMEIDEICITYEDKTMEVTSDIEMETEHNEVEIEDTYFEKNLFI